MACREKKQKIVYCNFLREKLWKPYGNGNRHFQFRFSIYKPNQPIYIHNMASFLVSYCKDLCNAVTIKWCWSLEISTLKHTVVVIWGNTLFPTAEAKVTYLHIPQEQTWQLVNKFKPNIILSSDYIKVWKCLKLVLPKNSAFDLIAVTLKTNWEIAINCYVI